MAWVTSPQIGVVLSALVRTSSLVGSHGNAPYSVRTFRVGVALTRAKPQGHRPGKTSAIELRASEDDRDLLDRAAAAQRLLERLSPFLNPAADQPQA